MLNSVTRKYSYPYPPLDDTLATLVRSNIFYTLDSQSGYLLVEMGEEAREKVAYNVGTGLRQGDS